MIKDNENDSKDGKKKTEWLVSQATYESSDSIVPNDELSITQKYSKEVRDEKFDNKNARDDFKKSNVATTNDPISGNELTMTVKEAKEMYGEEYTHYVAETDHIVSIKEGHELVKNNQFLSDEDLKEIINSDENFQLLSMHNNRSMKDMSVDEYIEKLKEQGIEINNEEELLRRQKEAREYLKRRIIWRTTKNVASEALTGAKEALTASAIPLAFLLISNIYDAVINKKPPKEATKTIVKTTVKSIGTIAVTGAVSQVLATGLKNTKYEILSNMLDSQLPAKIVSWGLVLKDDTIGIIKGTVSPQDGVQRILEKVFAMMGSAAGRALGAFVLPPVISHFGGTAVLGTVAAKYFEACAHNILDEVCGHGAWEAMKNASVSCECMAYSLKASAEIIGEHQFTICKNIQRTREIQQQTKNNLDNIDKMIKENK